MNSSAQAVPRIAASRQPRSSRNAGKGGRLMGWRSIKRVGGLVLLQAVILTLLAWIVPGFSFSDPLRVVPAALAITAAQSLLWPLIYSVASRFGPLLFPILSFL